MSQHDNTAPDSQGPVDRPVRPPPMLLACPFCGVPPKMIWRRINPRGGCKTDGCMGAKLPALSLDRQEDIDAWNTRSNARLTAPDTAHRSNDELDEAARHGGSG